MNLSIECNANWAYLCISRHSFRFAGSHKVPYHEPRRSCMAINQINPQRTNVMLFSDWGISSFRKINNLSDVSRSVLIMARLPMKVLSRTTNISVLYWYCCRSPLRFWQKISPASWLDLLNSSLLYYDLSLCRLIRSVVSNTEPASKFWYLTINKCQISS